MMCKITIDDRWTDTEGKVWYELAIDVMPGWKNFVLVKIDVDGGIMEMMWRNVEYSKEIDTESSDYSIHYKQ
jgi:hypothetical protein